MSILKSLINADCLTTEESGSSEVVVKKEYNGMDSEKDFICIRKDYLLLLDEHIDSQIKELKQYEGAFNKIKNCMQEIDESII